LRNTWEKRKDEPDMNRTRKKIAWGITGGGDRLPETIEAMKYVKEQYGNMVSIEVFLSKSSVNVLKRYQVLDNLQKNFERITTEVDSNTPFLAGWLEMGKYEFLLIAPTSSNTAAKIAVGIADSLLSNAATMALKGLGFVYIMPTDYRAGRIVTVLPSGRKMKLQMRKEDIMNVERLKQMRGITVIETPNEISSIFQKHFSDGKSRERLA